jgi:hypothetical protein
VLVMAPDSKPSVAHQNSKTSTSTSNFKRKLLYGDAFPQNPRRATPHGRVAQICGRGVKKKRPPPTGATPPKRKLPQVVASWGPCSNHDPDHGQTRFVWAVPHHPRRATPHGRVEHCCQRAEKTERPPTTGATRPEKAFSHSHSGVAGWEPCSNPDHPTRCRWATAHHCDQLGQGVPGGCWRPFIQCFGGRGVSR